MSGFSAGSGRDTFITWNRGGLINVSGDRKDFNATLCGRGSNVTTPSHAKKQRRPSTNPTGRFRPRPPKILNEGSGPAYGKISRDEGSFSVAEMFSSMQVPASPHSTPKQNRAKKIVTIRHNISTCNITVQKKRAKFLEKSRARQTEAAKYERHSSGRVRVSKKKKGFRNCHS